MDTLFSYIFLGLGKADRELMANLDLSDTFLLQADEGKWRCSCCIITKTKLTFLI